MFSTIDPHTNTLHGGPEPHNYAEGCPSFGALCLKRLTERGANVVLIDALSGEQITALQLRDQAIRVARTLQAIGLSCGQVVSISAGNRKEFAQVLLGAALLGVTVAPLNCTYTEDELHHAVNLSKPRLIFTDPANHAKCSRVAQRNHFIQRVIAFNDEFHAEFTSPRRLSTTTTAFHSPSQPSIDDTVALILCSSGTTGLPKGVQLTQLNVMVGIHQHMYRPQAAEQRHAPEAILLGVLPWFHAYGCLTLLAYLLHAAGSGRIVFLPRFEATAALSAIARYRVNTANLVPPLMVFLAKDRAVDEHDLSSLAVIWCGAAPLSAELEQAVRRRLSIAVIRQGYGLSEATLALCGQTDELHTEGSVGVLRHGLEARVVDVQTGRALAAGQRGELWFRGSVIMKGYVGDAEATQTMVDRDGWLHTGDIGYYEESGELFVVDRLKELIKYKGFQVPPAELEGVLLQHPQIMDAGVVGVPDEEAGELPLAFVVLRKGGVELSEAEVAGYVAQKVSSAKRLRGGVRFVAEIPKSPSGKILRRELREMLATQRAKL